MDIEAIGPGGRLKRLVAVVEVLFMKMVLYKFEARFGHLPHAGYTPHQEGEQH